MAIHFDETMVGYLNGPEGRQGFGFEISVRGGSFLGAWGRDYLSIEGKVSLDGVVLGARVEPGSFLRIGLPFRRRLDYTLAFKDVQGRQYRFFGHKRIRYLRFPFTIRKLTGTVFVDGRELGHAVLYFRYSTLPRFLASFVSRASATR